MRCIDNGSALIFGAAGCKFRGTLGKRKVEGTIDRVQIERGHNGRRILCFIPKEKDAIPFKLDPALGVCEKNGCDYTIDTKLFGSYVIYNVRT